MKDNVNHPTHYTGGAVECIDAIESAVSDLNGIEAFCTANAIKYLWRWKRKNGVEDLQKAKWYIDKVIAVQTAVLLFFCLPIICRAQSIDTVINNKVYTSYFNYQLHQPLFVAYKLYKGGGDCSRAGMRFTTDGLDSSATAADYAASGYDEGHLCNAEDEAGDCDRERATFHFYNCQPQTPMLNRGIWKHWETQIRAESQTDSILVVCGGVFGSKRIGHAAVPDYCYKITLSISTGNVTHAFIFPNDNSDTVANITDAGIKNHVLQLLTRQIPYSQFANFVKNHL